GSRRLALQPPDHEPTTRLVYHRHRSPPHTQIASQSRRARANTDLHDRPLKTKRGRQDLPDWHSSRPSKNPQPGRRTTATQLRTTGQTPAQDRAARTTADLHDRRPSRPRPHMTARTEARARPAGSRRLALQPPDHEPTTRPVYHRQRSPAHT